VNSRNKGNRYVALHFSKKAGENEKGKSDDRNDGLVDE
jgi:hypothetical protein